MPYWHILINELDTDPLYLFKFKKVTLIWRSENYSLMFLCFKHTRCGYLKIVEFDIIVSVIWQVSKLCVFVVVASGNKQLKVNNFAGELTEGVVKTERVVTRL